jgi:serine/threonine protein kinase
MDERELPPAIGRYRVTRLLGRGSMGRVLLAKDPVLDRDVAVKLLRDDLSLPPEQRAALLERMRQEARASARVAHPHIVGLYDMGEDPDYGLYLVFEYAEGETLKARLLRGPLGPETAAKLARQIAGALHTAHLAGVLHRDIKPENIILTANGGKIADFGIARVPDSTLTRDGGLLGTPAYSAPECIKRGEFSPKSDQFSMAATFYEALSGHRPFPGEDAIAVASRITTDDPIPIAASCGLDPHVDGVLFRGLAKDFEARFPTTLDFGEALAEALERRTRSAQPTLPDQQHRFAAAPSQRSSWGAAALGALAGVTAMQLTAGLRAGDSSPLVTPAAATSSTAAVAYLSESPRPAKPKPSPTHAIKRFTPAEAPSRAKAVPPPAPTPSFAAPSPSSELDAGAEPPSPDVEP